MKRRDMLVGAGSVAVLAAGGWVAYSQTGTGTREVEPATVATIDAPGSSAGEQVVPESGSVHVIDLFATYCNACVPQLQNLAAAREEAPDDVTFVSVACQNVGEDLSVSDLRDWWNEHGGPWTVGHDAECQLGTRLDAGPFPYTAIVDADRRLVWGESGVTDVGTIGEKIAAARGGNGAGEK